MWSHNDKGRFSEPMGADGPRATPTIAGDRVFTMGANGLLSCLELDTGKVTVTSGPSAYTIFLLLNQGTAVSPATSNPQYVSAVKKAIDYSGLLGVAGTGAVQPAGIIPSLIAGTLPAAQGRAMFGAVS